MKCIKLVLIFSLVVLSLTIDVASSQSISLAGEWNFALDADRRYTPKDEFADRIMLPGTTDEARRGTESAKSDFGILTRRWKYYGLAWYSREIEIPKDWAGKCIFLEMERVMWQSKVYLDGRELSCRDALNSPHVHDLGKLSPGKYRLVVSIDNSQIHNVGDKGHLYTEYTQSIWNGVVGRIALTARSLTRLNAPQIYTRIDPCSITVIDTLTIENQRREKLTMRYSLRDRSSGELLWTRTAVQSSPEIMFTDSMPRSIRLWDDVNPNLYDFTMSLYDGRGRILDEQSFEIGFREVSSRGTQLLVNGKPVFLRGNLDCVHFPLTGYPSCDVAQWERIFKIYKDYGLNHVRFHSWTPPAAAFTAASRVGIYVQSEVLWLDWWMALNQPDRPEMYTNGLPKGLGENPSAEAFTQAEMSRMVRWYGNQASFVMMCIGNELGNSNFELMESWIRPYKDRDSRRLYASSAARRINPSDEYLVTHYIDGLGATRGLRGGASLDWDFEDVYSRSSIPVIAHEIGQWPVYPRWSEIKKYKGVLRAMNFEEFADVARRNGVYDQNEDFVAASGALNQLMYKYEIESFLRTPSCSGIQLLSMQDYQGQGEALIGWLDVFYDSKGITSPERFRRHHDSIVPLLRLPKFVWSGREQLAARIQLAQWGKETLRDRIVWKIEDDVLRVLAHDTLALRDYERATSEIVGELSFSLKKIERACRLRITVSLASSDIENSWYVWVYPDLKQEEAVRATVAVCPEVLQPMKSSGALQRVESPETSGRISRSSSSKDESRPEGVIYETRRFDRETIARLDRGESVLLDASELGTELTSDVLNFFPLYWSLTFFPGQGKNTLGMVVRKDHPVYRSFPTSSHSDWQWQTIYKGARGFYINDFPADYRPMAQPVDDFHRNNFVASIFEMRVGRGRLLVSGFNLADTTNLVARQLRHSMLEYMRSSDFNPSLEREADALTRMFHHTEPLRSEVPIEFVDALLYVEAAALQSVDGNQLWNRSQDKAISTRGAGYTVECDGTWRDTMGTAWHGKQMNITIDCPKGFIGSLYLFFYDWNKVGRRARITFEGRDYLLDSHEQGQWVRLHVMREDSNKGILNLNITSTKGANTMLSKMVLVEDRE